MHSFNTLFSFWGGRLLVKIFVLCNILNYSLALYEDQVGKFDWRQQYIGNVINAYFDHNVGNHKILVATEDNVLAAINPRTNQTIWRQVLEPGSAGKIHKFVVNGNEIITLSGQNLLVRSWSSNNGILNWEASLASTSVGNFQTFFSIRLKESLIIVAECLEAEYVNFNYYNFQSSDLIKSQKIPAHWFNKKLKCQFTSDSLFVCIDGTANGKSKIYHFDLNIDTNFLSTGQTDPDFVDPSIDILLMTNNFGSLKSNLFAIRNPSNQVLLLEKKENGLNVVQKISGVVAINSALVNEALVVNLLIKNEKDYIFKVFNSVNRAYIEEIGGPLSFPEHYGIPSKIFVDISAKRDGGHAWRILLTTSCHSVLYFNAGVLLWNREESLASIVSVEMVELPISESDAQMEEQFGNVNANVMVLFLKRLTTQLVQLQSFLTRLLLNIQSDSSSKASETKTIDLIRDEFDIHKIIVVVTSTGKIFGLDSFTGTIIWQQFVDELKPFQRYNKPHLPLHVLRTTAHYSHTPQCAVIGMYKGVTSIFTFNPITGEPIGENNGITILKSRMIQAMQLPFYDAEFLRGVVFLDSNYKVHVFPKSYYNVAIKHTSSLYMFVADSNMGSLSGFRLSLSTSEELIATQIWSLTFPTESQLITNVIMKRGDEHVHSQGRVMGDRSVLYKYLNPNLAVITTESPPGPHQSSLNVYLLDVVSGQIVFSANHKRAKGPIQIVHSENWVVYSFMSEKARRMELAVFELYEGKTQSNTTYFSSLSPPPYPMVERQAYVFPSQIDSLAVTITQKGITAKHVLVALPSGGLLELPKAFLDPRRSLFPTAEHREEGIIPYNPELPISTENIINYYQSINRVRNIYTAPTGLESTCLVFAYGLDLFYTRITPSRTFDVLKEDFDHWIIVMALTGLLVASYATKKLAAKKALKQAWK